MFITGIFISQSPKFGPGAARHLLLNQNHLEFAHRDVWRSRLARFLHTEEVTGSSPVTST